MSRSAVLTCERLVKVYPSPSGDVVAADDVGLVVTPGESVVLIGPNGAGKSTLLRLVAGITEPTSGRIGRARRTTGLIELGAGFEPELTGRENLEITLALQGFGSRARRSAAAAVIAFSGLGAAIDRPVKHYSAGMVARLGLSAALHSEPDLLLVDEVLTVGDTGFQRRALQRIRKLIDGGCALLLVTHQLALARRLATRVVWLDGGRVRRDGEPSTVVAEYERHHSVHTRMQDQDHTRLISVALDPEVIEPGGRLDVSVVLSSTLEPGRLSLRVDLRAPVGDDDRWMLDRSDPNHDLELNTIARSAAVPVQVPPSGHADITLSLAGVPLTPTTVEAVVMVMDERGALLDELGAMLTIRVGDVTSTDIPRLFIEAVGPLPPGASGPVG